MLTDLKFALRSLLKTPGFTLIVVLTLALGIGATTAIFSVVNSVLLQPLPYKNPEQLVRVYTEFPTFENGTGQRFWVSKPEYLDLKRAATSWDSIEAWSNSGVNIAASGQPVRATASFVTGGMLRSLGAVPIMGRGLGEQDDAPGATRVATISYGLWQRMFGADRSIVGREILLNGEKCTIVGVMSRGFQFPPGEVDQPEVWTPLQIDPAKLGDRSNHTLSVLGRLKPGAMPSQAQSELDALVRHWGKTSSMHHFSPEFHTVVIHGLHDEVVRNVRPALRMLFGAVFFLLLIACINVANLLLARAEARQREIAIRGALGAGLWRLARQFATEGFVLALSAAAIGLLLAGGGLKLIQFAGSTSLPRAAEIGIDGLVVLFAIALSLLTAVIFALAPLAHVARQNLLGAMKSAGASTTDAVGAQRFRHVLVVSQLALALVLLMGTGLMLRAFWNLQEADAGLDPRGVTTLSFALPQAAYSDQASRDFWTRLDQRLNALPGVEAATLASSLPPVNPPNYSTAQVERFVSTEGSPYLNVDYLQLISRGYFDTLKVRLLEGRFFEARDFSSDSAVVIVNQTMARAAWGDSSPIGRRIHPYLSSRWLTVIGVVADVKNAGVANPTGTAAYFPFTIALDHADIFGFFLRGVSVAVRSQSGSTSAVRSVRRVIGEMDPALPITNVRTMNEVMSDAQARPRFLTLLLTLFASVALTLAAVGIYGVISYSVVQRTKEFGIRMALGAQQGAVLGLVLQRGLLLTVCGLAAGLAGAFMLTRFLSGFLFGVTATDPATFVGVSLLLGGIAILASYIPARRATRVDPLIALRAE